MRFHLLKILTILSIVIYPCYAYSQNSVKGSIKDNYNNSITGAAIAMQSLNDTLFVRGVSRIIMESFRLMICHPVITDCLSRV